MIRTAVGFAAMLLAAGLGLAGDDASRDHDLQDAVIKSQMRAYEQQRKSTEDAFRRDFELKFNRLVKAAEEFSKAYNESKGMTWPADKAEALRRAMTDLQKQQQFRTVTATR